MRKYKITCSLVACLFLLPLAGRTQVITIEKSILNTCLFDTFSKGTVFLKNKSVQEAELNYETENSSIVFKGNGQVLTLTNIDDVDTVMIQGRKFVPIDKKFYEVLDVSGTGLYASYTNKRKPVVASPDHEGTKKGVGSVASNSVAPAYVSRPFQSNYIVEVYSHFWLRKGNSLYKANNEKQVIRMFPLKHSEAIKSYIRDNNVNFDKQEDVKKLVAYCNTQLK